MCLFFKKKENKPTVCNHKWKDFPWYSLYGYDELKDRYFFKIIKPYVCIKCKERRDEQLMRFSSESLKERDRELEKYHEMYKDKLLDLVEVEDMVKDEQLVDREYLSLLEQFENPTDRFAGLDLFAEIQKAKKEAGVPPGISVPIGG